MLARLTNLGRIFETLNRVTANADGGCPMSTMEVLTLFLVIIGVCNLFIQMLNKKK